MTKIIVIGGGPGGYVAAIRAAQLGMEVILIEAEHLGGICLNWGCIPTKALLRSAEIFQHTKHLEQFGLAAKGVSFDLKKIVARSRAISGQLSGGIAHLLKKNKVQVIDGRAKLLGKGKVQVTDKSGKTQELTAAHIIIATGAKPRVLPGFEPDGKLIWTYKEAMTPDKMPASLLVVGSGAIGMEFASFYRTLGAKVTVVEVAERILMAEDEEIAAMAAKAFSKQGIEIITSANLVALNKKKDAVEAVFKAGGKEHKQSFERVIMAVGITANTEGLGLENTKVKLDRGHIICNEWLATDEPGVYAIGDVSGAPWLAHKASHEGIICVEKIGNQPHVQAMKRGNIPGCTYSLPQIASVGMTEKQAKDKGLQVKVGRFPFIGNGKAIALGEPEGMIKTIFDAKTGELLGAHMIGAEVTELIQGYAIAKTMEATEQDLMHTIFPHPTLSEMMHESVLAAFGHAIHM